MNTEMQNCHKKNQNNPQKVQIVHRQTESETESQNKNTDKETQNNF